MKKLLPVMKEAHDSLRHRINFNWQMKFSWTSLKISIAGGKLSHLVQKDKIWDHGSMTEQARIIFYLIQKARTNGNIETLKKYCTVPCFAKLKSEMDEENKYEERLLKNPMIKELAVMEVYPGKNNKPDMFTALLRIVSKNETADEEHGYGFSAQWSFIRQGDWWMLDNMKIKNSFLKII